MTSAKDADLEASLRDLIDEYRDRCLWFLRRDYYPATRDEALRTLAAIQRQGDMQAFRRAAQIKQWLLQDSSESSAG
jgi:hypothetical protein